MTPIQCVFHKKKEIQTAKGCASLPAFHLSSALFSVPEESPLGHWVSWKPEGARSEGEKKDAVSFLSSARKLKPSHAATFCAVAMYSVSSS